MEITYHIFTNKGSYEVNEDSAGVIQKNDAWCFTLADGLGGHGYGEIASQTAVEAVKNVFLDNTSDDIECCLNCAFQNAQLAVRAKQNEDKNLVDMKTTLTALIIENNCFQWGHIGDSRVYLFRSGRYAARTLDHSVPQMLVASGKMKSKDIRGYVDRNRLLRVIGIEGNQPRYELSRIYKMHRKDSFLLCSDGFWDFIDEKTMSRLLRKSSDVKEWIEKMAEEVRKNGSGKRMDNFTAIGVWVRT